MAESVDRENDLPEALATIAEDLGVEPEFRLAGAGLTLDDVRSFVTGEVERLLRRRPSHLMSILYRVDVPEEQVKAAFATAPPEALASTLAQLLIDRQLLKIRIRRRYR